jgi:integrase
MPLAMIRPTPHPKSGVYRLRKSIPAQYRDTAQRLFGVRRELTVTLGTKDAREAVRLAPRYLDELERKMAAIRAAAERPPQHLSHMQVHAIAGDYYKARLAAEEAEPGARENWQLIREDLLDACPRDDDTGAWLDYEPTGRDITEAESLLADREIIADGASVRATAQALWLAKVQLAETMARRATGNYGPDEYAARYPDASALPRMTKDKPAKGKPLVTFEDVVRGWSLDAGYNPDATPIPRAYHERSRTAQRLAAFLGHDDVSGATRDDAVRWKEDMLMNTKKKASTIGNDISEMSAVWRWAVAHGKATDNPFKGILPPAKLRKKKAKKRPYTADEARQILLTARQARGPLRFLAWVLAATGARLNEVCQSNKEDVVDYDGQPFLHLHADDTDNDRTIGEAPRSLKTESSARSVPLHPRLIAEGFLNYVAALPPGSPLFPDILPDKRYGRRGNTAQKLMSEWIRDTVGIADKTVSPSHSWRHWWIDEARRAGLHGEVRHAITGHIDDENESANYGHGLRNMPAQLMAAMEKIEFPDGL